MKKPTLLFSVILVSFCLHAQNNTDPQILELQISTPQPRLGQKFQLRINVEPITNDLATLLGESVKQVNNNSQWHCEMMDIEMEATESGKASVGPIAFTFNNKKYITNKIEYDVAADLPPVTEGLWFRIVKIDEDEYYMIVEQRMATEEKSLRVKLNESPNLPAGMSITNTETHFTNDDMLDTNGNKVQFYLHTATYKIKIENTYKPVVLSKSHFANLPALYEFTELVLN